MNKGEMIRNDITKGLSNEAILSRVDTTLNSIRWHRSKMHASPSPRLGKVVRKTSVAGLTVGGALIKYGLADEVRQCLGRLETVTSFDPAKVYEDLASWKFITNGRVSGRFGQCSHKKRTIEVHAKILDLADDLRQTFLHECAHAIDRMIHGRSSGHGAEWKFIMAIGFRIPAIRCGGHSDEASEALRALKKTKAVETWSCQRCDHKLPIMRKRKAPPSSYTHRKCGGKFNLLAVH